MEPEHKRSCLGALAMIGAIVVSAAPPAAAQVFERPPREEWLAANDFGYWSDGTRVRIDEACLELPEEEQTDCSLEAFRANPFVVVALVDSGINPYHQAFRAPEFAHHPSSFVSGYPADAESVELSLEVADASGYDAAKASDADLFDELRGDRLYWVPGTRIIGAYVPGGGACPSGCFLDNHSHGTSSASVAAGRFFGANPNALVVALRGDLPGALSWAASQPWIDIVSNSWGTIANLPETDQMEVVEATKVATDRGQSVAFAAGNGAALTEVQALGCDCQDPGSLSTLTSNWAGPSWHLTVGAASPVHGQPYWWHDTPVDVVSFGRWWLSAHWQGVTLEDARDFGGTSNATPVVAGALSSIIERAREVLGDTGEGQRPGGAVAVAGPDADLPPTGPLSDGVLTRTEAEGILLRTARHVLFDEETATQDVSIRPTTGTPFDHLVQGYGLVDRDAAALADRVLLGLAPMPDRSDVDQTMLLTDAVRDAIWERTGP